MTLWRRTDVWSNNTRCPASQRTVDGPGIINVRLAGGDRRCSTDKGVGAAAATGTPVAASGTPAPEARTEANELSIEKIVEIVDAALGEMNEESIRQVGMAGRYSIPPT